MLRKVVLVIGLGAVAACSSGGPGKPIGPIGEEAYPGDGGYPGSSYDGVPRPGPGERPPVSSEAYPGGGSCARLCDIVLSCFGAPSYARAACIEACGRLNCSAAALAAVACLFEMGFACEEGELKLVNPNACELPEQELMSCGLFEDGGGNECDGITDPCARCLCERDGAYDQCVEVCQQPVE